MDYYTRTKDPNEDKVIELVDILKSLLSHIVLINILLKTLSTNYTTLMTNHPFGVGIKVNYAMIKMPEATDHTPFNINRLHVNTNLSKQEQIDELKNHLPTHLQDLFLRSIKNLAAS